MQITLSNKKRNNALDRVRSQLESARIFATTTEIQNKLHSLRVYYSSQRSKLEFSKKKSGSSTDEVIKVRWPYYEKLSFLNDYLQPRQTFSNLDMEDLDPSSPVSIASLENAPVPRPAKRKMPKKKKNVQVEETSESEFREVATKYMQKLTCGPAEKEKTADYHFCDMITKSLNAMIDGEQK